MAGKPREYMSGGETITADSIATNLAKLNTNGDNVLSAGKFITHLQTTIPAFLDSLAKQPGGLAAAIKAFGSRAADSPASVNILKDGLDPLKIAQLAGIRPEELQAALKARGIDTVESLTPQHVEALIAPFKDRILEATTGPARSGTF